MVSDATTTFEAAVPSPVLPAFVTIQITDVLIAPAGPDGNTWDGLSSVEPAKLEQISLGLGAVSSYAAVAGLTAGIALGQFQAPDPYGYMTRWTGSEWGDEIELPALDDGIHPQWPGLGWQHVGLDPVLRVRVSLWDDDSPFSSEPIGTVELTYQDVIDALRANEVWRVKTSIDASRQPILFVGISVAAEAPPRDAG